MAGKHDANHLVWNEKRCIGFPFASCGTEVLPEVAVDCQRGQPGWQGATQLIVPHNEGHITAYRETGCQDGEAWQTVSYAVNRQTGLVPECQSLWQLVSLVSYTAPGWVLKPAKPGWNL